MRPLYKSLLSPFLTRLSAFAPRLKTPCNHCLAPGNQWLCTHCFEDLPSITQCCTRCALPSPHSPCAQCLKSPPPYTKTYCAYWYMSPLDGLIRQLKQHQPIPVLKLLTPEFTCKLQKHYTDGYPDILVPAPSHWQKKLRRGFYPSLALAKNLSKNLNTSRPLPILPAVTHHQYTPEQKSLTRKQRLENLQQAFSIPSQYQPQIQGRFIAVVDDVITTGATATALSKCLLNAGAARVDIWALARTP